MVDEIRDVQGLFQYLRELLVQPQLMGNRGDQKEKEECKREDIARTKGEMVKMEGKIGRTNGKIPGHDSGLQRW